MSSNSETPAELARGMTAAERLGTSVSRALLRAAMAFYSSWLQMFVHSPESKPPLPDKVSILLTGTFYSDNWIKTHLLPLGLATQTSEVIMVASTPVPDMPNVRAIYPPRLLQRIAGGSGSRLLTFAWVALRKQPDFIGGFHLLINGLLALLLAETLGRRSIYICGGGQREVAGGGFNTENRLFNRLGHADPVVERHLLDATQRFDMIVTMGKSAKDYFLNHGVAGEVRVVPGGFDDGDSTDNPQGSKYDLVLVGRLSPVKRVERLIEALAILRSEGLSTTAVIVGDGPSGETLKNKAREFRVDDAIHFAGWQSNVHDWLHRSRIFVLTSDSEGLSQAMIQAMLCELPVVVSDVGDLGDLVNDGHNGCLVTDLTPAAFAERLRALLKDSAMLARMGRAACESAEHLTFDNVGKQWTEYFEKLQDPCPGVVGTGRD